MGIHNKKFILDAHVCVCVCVCLPLGGLDKMDKLWDIRRPFSPIDKQDRGNVVADAALVLQYVVAFDCVLLTFMKTLAISSVVDVAPYAVVLD